LTHRSELLEAGATEICAAEAKYVTWYVYMLSDVPSHAHRRSVMFAL
jgi:hypothetical protein